MQTDYDDYDDLDEGGFNWMLVTVLLLAIAGFFSLAWYAYQTGSKHAPQGDVLVIQADQSPVKEAPEFAGGRTFPHQEKTIYEAVNPQDGETVSVSILPPTQEPELAVAPEASDSADAKVAALIQQAVADMQKKNEQAADPEPVVKVQKPAPKAIAAQPKPAPVAASTGARIQLGAFRSNIEAEKKWQKILRANKDILSGKPHQVVKADLGAKGVFYRLRVAGFNNDKAANAICKTLSSRKQGCFVVR